MLEKKLLNVNCTNCKYFLVRSIARESGQITICGKCLNKSIDKKPAASFNEYCALWLPIEMQYEDLFDEK